MIDLNVIVAIGVVVGGLALGTAILAISALVWVTKGPEGHYPKPGYYWTDFGHEGEWTDRPPH